MKILLPLLLLLLLLLLLQLLQKKKLLLVVVLLMLLRLLLLINDNDNGKNILSHAISSTTIRHNMSINTHVLLNPFPNKPWFSRVYSTSLWKILWGKGEIAHNEQFLLFPQCFLSIWRTFCHFHQTKNCRLQSLSVWKSLKVVVWERVKVLNLIPLTMYIIIYVKRRENSTAICSQDQDTYPCFRGVFFTSIIFKYFRKKIHAGDQSEL